MHAADLEVEIKLVESEQAHAAEMLADGTTEWQIELLVADIH